MKIRQTERDRAKICPTSGSGTSPYRQSFEFFYFQPHCYFTGVLIWVPSVFWQLWEATTCQMTHVLLPGETLSAFVGLCKAWSGAVLCYSPSRLLAVGWEWQSQTHNPVAGPWSWKVTQLIPCPRQVSCIPVLLGTCSSSLFLKISTTLQVI